MGIETRGFLEKLKMREPVGFRAIVETRPALSLANPNRRLKEMPDVCASCTERNSHSDQTMEGKAQTKTFIDMLMKE